MIIPGVQVTALFEPEPVLPGAIGILGLVGVVDRGPLTPTAVGNMAELTDVFGPATRFTMPEARAAFMNGVSEIVVARVENKPGTEKAALELKDDDGDPVVILRARAEGTWARQIAARVTQVKTASGKAVKYVNIDIYLSGVVVESFSGLVMDEESPNYLFDRINQGSRLVVAFDPGFEVDPPAELSTAKQFETIAVAATATLDSITATARTPGSAGNQIVVGVTVSTGGVAEIVVRADGADPKPPYSGLTSPASIAAVNDPLVRFTATVMPAGTIADQRLQGGRDNDPSVLLLGTNPQLPLVELMPADPTLATAMVSVTKTATNSKAVDIIVTKASGEEVETFTGLVMDPDDPNYLVDVLQQSKSLRARDLAVRSASLTLPKEPATPKALDFELGPVPVTPDAYFDALDRLKQVEEVDLVIASTATQLGDPQALAVQKAVVTHCIEMADKARNRIGLGSIFVSENDKLSEILSHADDVRNDHFILTAPANTEGAMAGLLGRLDYFRAPTFKPIASVDAPLVPYTDTQLSKLITANVAVIAKRKGLGVIPVKGLLTSGRQINVQRTADVSVRRVKAIADRFIGLLNDDGTRNALRQQIIAMFLQMQRDGAIVPSVDGSSPAFAVAVYSSQNDFATGIVRIDVALRPVHAIDYIYATLLVQN
jgi:hypothetical protein